MIWLATRLAFHYRARLLATLFGVVFSAYLTLAETALYIGMMRMRPRSSVTPAPTFGWRRRAFRISISPSLSRMSG